MSDLNIGQSVKPKPPCRFAEHKMLEREVGPPRPIIWCKQLKVEISPIDGWCGRCICYKPEVQS